MIVKKMKMTKSDCSERMKRSEKKRKEVRNSNFEKRRAKIRRSPTSPKYFAEFVQNRLHD